jgi:hypothetical protein
MACEKLAKAYRLLLPGVDIDLVATRHVGFTQFVNTYVRSPAMLAKYANKTAAHQTLCRTAAAIAREIEKLAPATDRVSSPENAEYPLGARRLVDRLWLDSRAVPIRVPIAVIADDAGRARVSQAGRPRLPRMETLTTHGCAYIASFG